MKIFDPCKKCLVKSMCRERCESRQSYWDTRSEIVDWFIAISISMSVVGVGINFFQ